MKEALEDPSVIRNVKEKCKEIFEYEDKDKSGTLDVKEFIHTCKKYNKMHNLPEPTDEQVKEALQAFDEDNNGLLSLDEFQQMIILILKMQAEIEDAEAAYKRAEEGEDMSIGTEEEYKKQ